MLACSALAIIFPYFIEIDVAITAGDSIATALNKLQTQVNNRIATVSKEQIEAEGWRKESTIIGNTPLEFVDDYHKSFEDGFYSFSINHLHYSTIYIWDVNDGTRTLYRGKCPSINEFRTIVKLLNI